MIWCCVNSFENYDENLKNKFELVALFTILSLVAALAYKNLHFTSALCYNTLRCALTGSRTCPKKIQTKICTEKWRFLKLWLCVLDV